MLSLMDSLGIFRFGTLSLGLEPHLLVSQRINEIAGFFQGVSLGPYFAEKIEFIQ